MAGRYRVEALLGIGGYGEVYHVRDQQMDGRPLALKLHRVGQLRRRAHLALRAEFALLASFDHPNLARVYDFGFTEEGFAFFTEELVEGPTLYEALDLQEASGAELLAQVLRALDYLHTRGIVHGDIKPSNVLVDIAEQRVVVVDFGVTRTLGASPSDLRGSPTYMAPEVIRGWNVDGRADLYSLGVTLYRHLAGRFPFTGPDTKSVFRAHIEGRCRALGEDPLAHWVHRLLARDPRQRPASARDALRELSEATGHVVPVDTYATVASHIDYAPYVVRTELLDSVYAQALGRGVRTVIIEGEAGTGKTRLLQELRQRLQLDGARWLHVAATREADVPVDIALAARFFDGIEQRHLTAEERRVLARGLPFLRQGSQRFAEPLDPEREADVRRALLGELLARSSLRRGETTVVACEDLHWASAGQQSRLVQVLKAAERHGAHLLVVATMRTGAGDSCWAGLSPQVLSCDRFSAEESFSFIKALLGRVDVVEGTPFEARLRESPAAALWIQESLRLACDEGALQRVQTGFRRTGELRAIDLPTVLRRRIERLEPSSRDIALALALAGEQASLADLAQVSQRSSREVAEGIEDLLRYRIVVRVREEQAITLRMHDRFVDVIHEVAEPAVKCAMRERVARWLEERHPDDPVRLMAVAEGYAAGACHEDVARVLRHALALTERDGRPELGLRILDHGRRLGEDLGPEALLMEFDLAMHVGRTERAECVVWRASREAVSPAAIAWRRARLELSEGEPSMAMGRIRRHLPESCGTDRVEMHLVAADAAHAVGDRAQAIEHFRQAAERAGALKDLTRQARALFGQARMEASLGRRNTEASAEAAALVAGRAKEPALAADAQRLLGVARRDQGAVKAAERALRSALRGARDAGHVSLEAETLCDLGHVAFLRERYVDAGTAWRRALRLKRRVGLFSSAQYTLLCLASLMRSVGELAGAAELLQQHQRHPAGQTAGLAALLQGQLAVLQGDWHTAKERFRIARRRTTQERRLDVSAVAADAERRARLALGERVPPLAVPVSRRQLITNALIAARNADPRALAWSTEALAMAGPEEGSRGLFDGFFGDPVEVAWCAALTRHWIEGGPVDVVPVQQVLKQHVAQKEPEAPAMMRAHPVYGAVARGTQLLAPGCLWGAG